MWDQQGLALTLDHVKALPDHGHDRTTAGRSKVCERLAHTTQQGPNTGQMGPCSPAEHVDITYSKLATAPAIDEVRQGDL